MDKRTNVMEKPLIDPLSWLQLGPQAKARLAGRAAGRHAESHGPAAD